MAGLVAGFLIYRYYKRKRKEASDQEKIDNDSNYSGDTMVISDETDSIKSDAIIGLPDEAEYDIDKLNYNPNDILTSRNVQATFEISAEETFIEDDEEGDYFSDSDQMEKTSIEVCSHVGNIFEFEFKYLSCIHYFQNYIDMDCRDSGNETQRTPTKTTSTGSISNVLLCFKNLIVALCIPSVLSLTFILFYVISTNCLFICLIAYSC